MVDDRKPVSAPAAQPAVGTCPRISCHTALGIGLGLALCGQQLLDGWPVTLSGRVPLRLEVSARVALLSSCAAVCAVAVSALGPLWRATARHPMGRLPAAGSRTVASRATGRLLFACVQVAVCTTLVTASLLAFSQVRAELARPLGFDPGRLLAATIDVTQPAHEEPGSTIAGWLPALRDEAAALPGVKSVSVADFAPLSGAGAQRRLLVAGQPMTVHAVGTGSGYFETLRLPFLMGRAVQADGLSEVVVNQALWATLRARGLSLGGAVRLEDDGPSAGVLTVVGVVADARHLSPAAPPVPTVYLPAMPQILSARRAVLLLRTTERHDRHTDAVRRLVVRQLPDVPIWRLDWIEDQHAIALRPARVMLASLLAGGTITLALAMAGILALLTYIVGRSRREMGIRAALGATPLRAYLAVASGVVSATCVGLLVGGAAGWTGGHLLVGTAWRADSRDVLGALMVVAVMLSLSVLAPALRARHWDTARLIREE